METTLLWITATGSVLTAVFTCALWLVGWRTLGGAREQLKLLREQAERDGRPYLAIDVVPGLHGAGFWDLVIENTGRSVARAVKLEVPRWDAADPDDHITEPLRRFLAATHTIGPGARRRVMWRMSRDDIGVAGAPAVTTLAVAYQDETGGDLGESVTFDLETLAPLAPSPTEGARKGAGGRDLANIDFALRALSSHIAELRR